MNKRSSKELAVQVFEAGPTLLESGEELKETSIVFKTFGQLNAARDNVILVNTHFGGNHENSQYLIGEDKALNPNDYFIIVINLIGNGTSCSPSHGLGPLFPKVSIADNIKVQHRMLEKTFAINEIALVVGHSMGGVASYHWAALFPEIVKRAAPICGAAKISIHNDVFLQGMRGILMADPEWADGNYRQPPTHGLNAMARAWAAWPPSAHFYRKKHYEKLGYKSTEDFLTRYWEQTYCGLDANDLLAQITTWRTADISDNALYRGDFTSALQSIKALTYVMPCTTDAYFPPEDSMAEVDQIPNSRLMSIESEWGHWAGSGRNEADTTFINNALNQLLEEGI